VDELIDFDDLNNKSEIILPNKDKGSQKKQISGLLVFASFSMPEQSLKQLTEEVAHYSGTFVFRVLYRNSLRQTVNKVLSLRQEGVRAVIDPKLYNLYNIKVVPSIVLTEQCKDCTPIYDKAIGNIPLNYALELFANSGDLSKTAKVYLSTKVSRAND